MIIIKLHGGLGNQMFQYALGRNLSLIHKTSFKIDSSYLQKENQSGRTLRLSGFNTFLEEATPDEIRTYRSILQKMLDRLRPKSKRKKILEPSPEFDPNVSEITFDSAILKHNEGYFVGHWNDERYFKESEQIIRGDFTLKNNLGASAQKISEKILSSSQSVSVHIRRGDYVTIPKVANVHGALSISYYIEACDKILEKFPDAKFFISSDDINWTKENFPKKYSLTFVSCPEISDYEELTLMSQCQHNSTANSTMSFWGAWLNQNPNKIVITPKYWFRDKNREVKGLIPPQWIKIESR